MAISGIAMVGFLLAHLAGNLLVYAGAEAINSYAERLRDFPLVLWVARIGLIIAVGLHIYSSIKLTRINNMARPQKYVDRNWQVTKLSSRTMFLTGLIILSFIGYHLAHLTFRLTHPQFFELGPYDLYQMLIISFHSPIVTGFYVLSIVLLMMHLSHGITSMFQTLGIRHKNIQTGVRTIGPFLATFLGIGFISIPVAILLGFVK